MSNDLTTWTINNLLSEYAARIRDAERHRIHDDEDASYAAEVAANGYAEEIERRANTR